MCIPLVLCKIKSPDENSSEMSRDPDSHANTEQGLKDGRENIGCESSHHCESLRLLGNLGNTRQSPGNFLSCKVEFTRDTGLIGLRHSTPSLQMTNANWLCLF